MTANPRRRDPADVCWALPEVQRAELYRVLTSMGMPTIDRTLILPDNMAHLVSRDVTVLARRLLNALAALQEPQLVVQLSGATTTDPLCAWDIVEPSGRQLVQSILVADRKSVVSGKSVSVRVDLGCRRIIKKKKQNIKN